MISKGEILKTITATLVLTAAVMLLIAGCDQRRSMDTEELNEDLLAARVKNLLITLDPPQLNLQTSSAIDTSIVTIAAVDEDGVGISGVRVSINRNPQRGYLTSPDTTSANGVTTALFVTEPGIYGVTNIVAIVDTLIRSSVLYVTGPSEYELSIDHWPTIPKLIDRNGDPYRITATLVDTTLTGVAGHPIEFSILNGVGRLVDSSSTGNPVTNTEGKASVWFYNTAGDETDNPTSAVIQAVTTIPGSNTQYIAASTELDLLPVQNTLTLEAVDDIVFGDGSDSTLIRAILLDTYGGNQSERYCRDKLSPVPRSCGHYQDFRRISP
jgi:hypothetical protein